MLPCQSYSALTDSIHGFRALVLVAADRDRFAVENAALRQQINVLQRSVTRPSVDDTDRVFWIFLRRWVRDRRDVIALIKRLGVVNRE